MGRCYWCGRLFLKKGCDQVHLLFLHGNELFVLLPFVVLVLLLGVTDILVRGLHEGV